MSTIAMRLAEQVRALRVHAQMTQAALAARAGVTVETVARLERVLRGRASANSNPSLETMERLATALGVEVAELLQHPPSGQLGKPDRLMMTLRAATPATRRRVLRVAEALIREEASEKTTTPSGRRRERHHR